MSDNIGKDFGEACKITAPDIGESGKRKFFEDGGEIWIGHRGRLKYLCQMSKPRRQHFIPKSYLKHFAVPENNKSMVEVLNVHTRKITFPFSTSNLCVSKNLYTLPRAAENEKYKLEFFYAEHIDSVYPEVYAWLTDPAIVQITEEQRWKILSCCLSLYFRNDRFHSEKIAELESMFERMREQFGKTDDSTLVLSFLDRTYRFLKKDLDQTMEEAKKDFKEDFLTGHLAAWHEYIHFKNGAQIMVYTTPADFPLVTSDNPVFIDRGNHEQRDLFDPSNIIMMPLDPEHYLWIAPNDVHSDRLTIYRGELNQWAALSLNYRTQQRASEWVIGKKETVQLHQQHQQQYGEHNTENLQSIGNLEKLARGMQALVGDMEEKGVLHPSVIAQINVLKKDWVFRDDPGFQKLLKELTSIGVTFA
jgi:hypothetical protein